MAQAKITKLFLAEIAFFISWLAYKSSALSHFLNPVYLLPLATIPFLKTRSDPFDFKFFGLLIAMHLAYILPGTEVFNSFLDVLYFMGYKSFSEYMLSAFPPATSATLPIVVVLFCISHVSESKEGFALAIVVSAISLTIYGLFNPINADLLAAVIAIGVIALSAYAFKSSLKAS